MAIDIIIATRGNPYSSCMDAFNQIMPSDKEVHDEFGTAVDGYPDGKIADYGGLFAYRNQIAEEMGVNRDNVVVTKGSQNFFSRFCSLMRKKHGPLVVGTNIVTYDRYLQEARDEDHMAVALSAVDGIDLREADRTYQNLKKRGFTVGFLPFVWPGSNPSGQTNSVEKIMAIADFCSERGIYFLLDEAYRLFAYKKPLSLPFDDPVFKTTIRLFSESKPGKPDLQIGGGIIKDKYLANEMIKKAANGNIGRGLMNQAKVFMAKRSGKHHSHVQEIISTHYKPNAAQYSRCVAQDLPDAKFVTSEIEFGFFGLIGLEGITSEALISKVLEKGVKIADGKDHVPWNMLHRFENMALIRLPHGSLDYNDIPLVTQAIADVYYNR